MKLISTKFFNLIILLLPACFVYSQLGCEALDAGDDMTIGCNSEPCVDLTATIMAYPNKETTSYVVSEPTCPLPPLTGSPANLTIDDRWSSVIPITFSFDYFGSSYTQLVIGANGQVSFQTSLAGDYNDWGIDPGDDLPVNNSSFPYKTIYGAFHDLNPATYPNPSKINYFVSGTAPFRAFIVNFNDVSHFLCDDVKTTQQIILYETLNIIQVSIREKPICSSWNNGGLATLGLMGDNLSEYAVAPGRNTGIWTADNETYYFIPNGADDINTTFEWLDEDGNVIGTDLTVNVCPPEGVHVYTARFTFQLPDGTITTLEDTVTVTASLPFSIDIGDDISTCNQDDIILDASGGAPSGALYEWFIEDASQGPPSASNPTFTVTAPNSGNYSVSVVDPNDPSCIVTDEVDIEFLFQPEAQEPDALYACDEIPNDGYAQFTLTDRDSQIINGQSGVNVMYFETSVLAQNGDPADQLISPYTNTTPNTQTVYARLQAGDGSCFDIVELDLIVNPAPEIANPISDYNICDAGGDGIENIDLTEMDSEVLDGLSGMTVTYYTSFNNADSGTSHIDPATSYPASDGDEIFVRVENDDTGCYTIGSFFIHFGISENLNEVPNQTLCDDDFDGIYEADLTDLNDLALYPNTGYTFVYYANSADVTNNNPIPSTQWSNYEFTSMPGTIYMVAENTDGCRSPAIEIHFEEGQGINMLSAPYEISFCNGEAVDLTDFEDIFTNETGVDISYHTTLINAQNGNSPITNETNYTPASPGSVLYVRLEKDDRCPEVVEVEFIAGDEVAHNEGPFDPIEFCAGQTIDLTGLEGDISSSPGAVVFNYFDTLTAAQNDSGEIVNVTEFEPAGETGTIYVRLEQNGKCPVIVEITYAQRPAPSLQVSNEETLCSGEELEITATSDDTDAVFQWTSENGDVFTGATQTFTDLGTYTVIAIGSNACESAPQTVTIGPPAPPTITSIESGDGSITVYAANGGSGPMEYSLDGVLWQSSNQFSNLVNGETYTVYVRSDTCVVTSYKITILSVPNFVSPNGDGYNDEWTIRGIEVTPDATIKIFDRYGKVFVDTNFDGNYVWDGKYGGNPLPSGDYWYILNVPGDGVIVPQKYVGHISIRNQ